MGSKNILHLHAHELAIKGNVLINKPTLLPACNHSIAVFNDLQQLFAHQDWFGMGDIFSFMRSRPLKDLPLDLAQLKEPKYQENLKKGAADWQKFAYNFAIEHQSKYCHKGFADFMYCSFAKYYQPEAYERLKEIFIQEWRSPCAAIEDSQCVIISTAVDIAGLVWSLEFEGGAFGHIKFHANGSALEF